MGTIKYFAEIDSTNSYALREMAQLSHGTIISADRQTAGRGRNDHTWISNNPQNIYATFIIKQILPPHVAVTLTQYLAVITTRVLCSKLTPARCPVAIKWPNDLLALNKKLAGILCESTVHQGETHMALGIGLNLNSTPLELSAINQPATSVFALTGKPVDKTETLTNLAQAFWESFPEYCAKGFPSIQAEYSGLCTFLGETITVNRGTETITGVAQAIAPDGALILKTANDIVKLNSGEIHS